MPQIYEVKGFVSVHLSDRTVWSEQRKAKEQTGKERGPTRWYFSMKRIKKEWHQSLQDKWTPVIWVGHSHTQAQTDTHTLRPVVEREKGCGRLCIPDQSCLSREVSPADLGPDVVCICIVFFMQNMEFAKLCTDGEFQRRRTGVLVISEQLQLKSEYLKDMSFSSTLWHRKSGTKHVSSPKTVPWRTPEPQGSMFVIATVIKISLGKVEMWLNQIWNVTGRTVLVGERACVWAHVFFPLNWSGDSNFTTAV